MAESLGETIQEVETPQPQSNAGNDESSKVLWKTAETPAPELPTSTTTETESNEATKSAITSVDENNNNLTRWNGSLALNTCSVEEVPEMLQSASSVSQPPPPSSPLPVSEARHSVTMPEQCDLALSVRVSQASEQSQPLTATAAAVAFDLTTSSGEREQSKQTSTAAAPADEQKSRKPASEHQQPELVPEVPAAVKVVEKIKKKKKVVESKLMTGAANEKASEEKARGEMSTNEPALNDAGHSAKVVGDQTETKVINSSSVLDKANAATSSQSQPVTTGKDDDHKTKSEKTAVIGAEKAKSDDVIEPDSTKTVVKTKVLRAKTGPIAKVKVEPEALVEAKVPTKVAKQSQVTSDESKSLQKEQSKEVAVLPTSEKVVESKPKSKLDAKIANKVQTTDTKEALLASEPQEKVPITKPKSKIEVKETKVLPETEKVKAVQPKSKVELKNAKENQVTTIEEKSTSKEKPTEVKPISKEPEKVTKPKIKLENNEIKVEQNQVDLNETKITPKEKSLSSPEQKVTKPKSKIENAKTKTTTQIDTKESIIIKVQPKEEKLLPSVKPEPEQEKVLKPKSKVFENETKVVKNNEVDSKVTKMFSNDQAKPLEQEKVVMTKPKSKTAENETKVVKGNEVDLKVANNLSKDQAKLLEPKKVVITKAKSKSATDSKAISKQKKDVVQEKSLPITPKIEPLNEQPKETSKTLIETPKPEKVVKKSLTETNTVKPKTLSIEQTPIVLTETEKQLERAVSNEQKIEVKIGKPKKSKDTTELKPEKVKEPLSPPPVAGTKNVLKVVVPEIKEIRSPSPEPPVVTVKLPPKHAIAKAKSTEEKRPLDTTAEPPTEPVIKHAKTVTFAADQSSTTKELPKSDAITKPEVVKPKVVKKKEVTKKKAETESKLAPVTDDVTATKQQDELTKTETETKVEQPKKRRSKKKLRFREYTVDDFTFLAVLGRGSFGKVMYRLNV